MKPINTAFIMGGVAFFLIISSATAQQPKFPFTREPYYVNSGVHDGQAGLTADQNIAYRELISIPDAPWIRLRFQSYDLGSGKVERDTSKSVNHSEERSYILITSIEDGGKQRLDAESLPEWHMHSAYFNGGEVEVELHLAPKDRGVYFEIDEILAGENQNLQSQKKTITICGNDDRVSDTTSAAIGRVLAIVNGDTIAWCTGYIASNGSHLTAGHCFYEAQDSLIILEFHVPPSDPNGTPNFSEPENQYPINLSHYTYHDDGPNEVGDDWGIFECNRNSNTGKLPVEVQQAFYRLSYDSYPDTVRVTGYGIDNDPVGQPGGPCPWWIDDCNEDSQTRQTDSGEFLDEDRQGDSDVVIEYEVDTWSGNSGSPVLNEHPDSLFSIGIHTTGGCNPAQNEGNIGTGFEHQTLADSIDRFPGNNYTYVDVGHPISFENGSVFRPYESIALAVTKTASGGTISIVKGYYNEPSLIINRDMTLVAPVGTVVIGTSGPSSSIQRPPRSYPEIAADTSQGQSPFEYALSPNYPNPFNTETTINYSIREDGRVSLKVYNLRGEEIRSLVQGYQPAALYSMIWDGKDNRGRDIPSGIYILRIRAGAFTKSIKMLLLK
ncbi:MAG: T9SS type A sorting domain-containing protein [Fidelibacterota bacterium]|nr:MAG: T9SS type A sorting domain-containing protein [Candidatus Neomarinimicrobiota bacterium]